MANDIISALSRLPRRKFGKPTQAAIEALVGRDINAEEHKESWAAFKAGARPEVETKLLSRKRYEVMIGDLQSGIIPWGGEYWPDWVHAVKLDIIKAYLNGTEPTTPFHFKTDWEDAMTGGKPGCAVMWGDDRRWCVLFTTKMAVMVDPETKKRITNLDDPRYSMVHRRALVL